MFWHPGTKLDLLVGREMAGLEEMAGFEISGQTVGIGAVDFLGLLGCMVAAGSGSMCGLIMLTMLEVEPLSYWSLQSLDIVLSHVWHCCSGHIDC